MSVHYTSPVWKLDLPTVAKIVLLKFGDNANDDGYAWPSLPRVARETGLGLSTVREKVSRFRRHGVLVLKAGGKGGRGSRDYQDEAPGATTRYFIDMPRARELYRPGEQGFEFEPGPEGVIVAESNPPGAGGLDVIANPPDETPNPPDETPNPPAPGIPPTPPYKDEPSSEPSSEPARARDPFAGGDRDARTLEANRAGKRPWEVLSRTRLVSAVAARRAERGTTVRLGGITEAERQAADAYIAAVARGEIEDVGGLAAPHACDVWRRHEQRIEAAVGDKAWRSWVSMITPHADDGKTLTLAAPSRLIAGTVERDHAEQIGKITERKIVVEVHAYAGPAAHQRQRREASMGVAS